MSTRIRLVFSSLLLSVFLLVHVIIENKLLSIAIFGVYLIIAIYLLWLIIGKKLTKKGGILVLIFTPVSLVPYWIASDIIFSIELNSFFENNIIEFSILLIFSFFLHYIFLLISNIYNGLNDRYIPLEQVAKTTQFIFSLFSIYILVFISFSNIEESGSIFFIVLLVFIAFFQIYTNIFFSRDEDKLGKADQIGLNEKSRVTPFNLIIIIISSIKKESIYESVLLSMLVLISFFALVSWPTQVIFKSLSVTLLYYLVFNLFIETKNKTRTNLKLEFFFVISVVLFTLILNSVWGINGGLFL